MKRYFAAAGALFLGASVLGLSADAQTPDKSVHAAKLASEDKGAIIAKLDAEPDTKIETSSVDDTLPADKAELLAMGGPDEMPVATTLAAVPASAEVIQPSNANPERDERGIAVISDVAYVPPGWNGIPSAGAMGGPVEGDDESYPPCTAERTDNCTQTYE